MRPLRRTSGARFPGWAAADGAALLHQFSLADLYQAGAVTLPQSCGHNKTPSGKDGVYANLELCVEACRCD